MRFDAEKMKAACCGAGALLMLASIVGLILFQTEIMAWIRGNFMLRAPLALAGGVADAALIVTLIAKGGCANELSYPHTYKSRRGWRRQR